MLVEWYFMPRKPIPVSKEFIQKRYVEDGASVRDVACEVGCSMSAISRALKRYDIKARTFSTKGLQIRLGATLSKETKNKIRLSHLGKKLSRGHREKVVKYLNHGRGNLNPGWRGGVVKNGNGYVMIRMPEHPFNINGYVAEHRLLIEQSIGRYLSSNEHIHHLNGDKTDNRIENMVVLSNEEHAAIHWKNDEAREKSRIRMVEIRKQKYWSTKRKH